MISIYALEPVRLLATGQRSHASTSSLKGEAKRGGLLRSHALKCTQQHMSHSQRPRTTSLLTLLKMHALQRDCNISHIEQSQCGSCTGRSS